jgi:organic hydroperoxide reductase OsmC/OhrA
LEKQHQYTVTLDWTGNKGTGTSSYIAYERNHTIHALQKPILYASSDAAFRGDATKYNPEELFVAAISSCHMLWYLHLCANSGVIVTAYTDNAIGQMLETNDGGGKFTNVTLYPSVIVTHEHMIEKALTLHAEAHRFCFIANSCNFPIQHQPVCVIQA